MLRLEDGEPLVVDHLPRGHEDRVAGVFECDVSCLVARLVPGGQRGRPVITQGDGRLGDKPSLEQRAVGR